MMIQLADAIESATGQAGISRPKFPDGGSIDITAECGGRYRGHHLAHLLLRFLRLNDRTEADHPGGGQTQCPFVILHSFLLRLSL